MNLTSLDYSKLKIQGLCYVRVVKNSCGEDGGYLIIDNNNKPIKNAYYYLKNRKKKGDSLNSIKRKAYDLCHFFNFMSINNVDEELMTYEYFFNFVSEFLVGLNPNFKTGDVIEKSMLNKVPVLAAISNTKVELIGKVGIGGYTEKSVEKIVNSAKDYLVFLKKERGLDIDLDDMFDEIVFRIKDNSKLGHLNKGYHLIYSVKGILKNAQISVVAKRILAINSTQIFEPKEENAFFTELNSRKYSNSYKLLFYLAKKTGMRVSELLGLRIDKIIYNGTELDLQKTDADIFLIDQDKWKVNIKVRKDNPPDLRIKGNKPREIVVLDPTKELRNLLREAIIYRNIVMRKKNKIGEHNYLFINRNGDRLKYQIVRETFRNIAKVAGLKQRLGRGKLVIHSFRHTFASKWIKVMKVHNKDVELVELSKYLGHSSTETTKEIYAHFFEEDIKNILGKMESAKHQREVT